MGEENKGNEFVIRDRRMSSSENSGDTSEPKAKQPEKGPSGTEPTEESGEQGRTGPLPELDFSSFILSLATTAQVSLGNIPNPETNQPAKNLPVAKQMIDMLGMLKDKTKGNLTEDEQGLLDSVLFNLRMQFVRTAEDKQKEDKK